MKDEPVLVVGDDFSGFGSLKGATTVSRLACMLDGRATNGTLPGHVVVGQGVSESWLNYMKSRVEARGLSMEFTGGQHVVQRTGRRFAHKHQRRNILVTDPVQVSASRYQCQLSVEDGCEITSDHVTGFHLQGMLLLEAARQTFLAVTEWFLLQSTEKHYFVINCMDVRYLKFAFPVLTDIKFDVVELDRSRSDRLTVKANISFMQNGECVTTVSVEYAAVVESRLHKREEEMAQAAVHNALAAMRPGVAAGEALAA